MQGTSGEGVTVKCFFTKEDIEIRKILEKEILQYISNEIAKICDNNTLFCNIEGL